MMFSKSACLVWLLAASSSDAFPTRFSRHLNCPYAAEWLAKGPVQATLDLGLNNVTFHSGRDLQEAAPAAGSCLFPNVWSGQDDCLEFRGEAWTTEIMQARCNTEENSRLAPGQACPLPSPMAGWCWLATEEAAAQAQPMALPPAGPMADCNAMKSACEGMMSGTWEAAGACDGEESATTTTMSGMPPMYGNGTIPGGTGEGPPICMIAPGPIGAGHQAAYSTGYRPNCEGTPAESSPYMWPMGWTASLQSESMAYGSDDILFTSRGKVYYRLDKNWKRSDTTFSEGVQRSIGQIPCEPENVVPQEDGGPLVACNRTSADRTTMIHRGSKMMFIDWNDNTTNFNDASNIASCRWLDLAVIGNIRNDWFLDDRGDSTDVQYLGDQHVYHDGQPRLVKQWRKTDFADMYFVMSVLANPKEDGIHWPMVLNVPGEGFGDDFLQKYSDHALLTDDDDALFLLDEALEAMGGTCEKMAQDGGFSGPPVGETVEVPSNLEVDPNAWVHNVYTFSPVWEPPSPEVTMDTTTPSTGMGMVEAGNVRVSSCYHEDSGAVQIHVDFMDVAVSDDGELPWMAIGYRPTEECLMTPRGGGNTDMILVSMDAEGNPVASMGSMGPELKSFNNDAVMSVYQTLTPLAETEGFSDVKVLVPDTTETSVARATTPSLTLHYLQDIEVLPEAMHLMYAVGSSPQMGYHSSRECFEVTEFPICPADSGPAMRGSHTMDQQAAEAETKEHMASEEKTGATPTSSAALFRMVSVPLAVIVSAML